MEISGKEPRSQTEKRGTVEMAMGLPRKLANEINAVEAQRNKKKR